MANSNPIGTPPTESGLYARSLGLDLRQLHNLGGMERLKAMSEDSRVGLISVVVRHTREKRHGLLATRQRFRIPMPSKKSDIPGEMRSKLFAEYLQEATARTTGDPCRVVGRRDGWEVQRWTGSRWVRA